MELKDHVPELTTASREEAVANKEIVKFDPSRMIGIIKRKALIKELAAAYHAECIACGQELLQLQKKLEEQYAERKAPEETRKALKRPKKRSKKEH
ncbi:uncharacterized protein LOC110099988 isoform X2 [Dendrobium catenatum]|uniref:Uncharacterized protein n=1 Tax=Dendrobium nobile TaxID=94219 RepID=A0A8T3AUT8_DENNO|nr:uncharacterized protein LOC110099988 isoform X2 [Dendrobium catenatum]KAI0500386.1 hypothetical protein KFK09_018598 [Dendrobium nobile]